MMKILVKVTWIKRFSFIFGLLFGVLMMPGVSYAHLVEMLSSFPENGAIISQSPELITAVFDEEVQTDTSTMQVFDAAGNQVDSGNGGVDLNDPDHVTMQVNVPSLAEGAYTVRWHVVLVDSDATAGAFNFFVGNEATATAANFTPIPDGSEVATTAVPNAGPNNIIWLVAGILATAVFIGGGVFIFSRRSSST